MEEFFAQNVYVGENPPKPNQSSSTEAFVRVYMDFNEFRSPLAIPTTKTTQISGFHIVSAKIRIGGMIKIPK